MLRLNMRAIQVVAASLGLALSGCDSSPLLVAAEDTGGDAGFDEVQFVSGASGFPAERDLAILFPLEEDPYIRASTRTPAGDPLLPSGWVDVVGRAFDGTLAEDAIGRESFYEEWRLVSARVVPCAPVARSPALAPASVCWPIVRLVWQPVAGGVNQWGVRFDAYADDRAIHTLYPLQARDTNGARVSDSARSAVVDHLDRGGRVSELSASTLAAFDRSRDDTTTAMLRDLVSLRDNSLSQDSWDGIYLRPELMESDAEADVFVQRFVAFLGRYASPSDMREMTAFSLPEGRNPAGDDAWTFIQLRSDGSSIWQSNLEVYSRNSGDLLLDYGLEQTAGQAHESDAVTEALESGPDELHETVVERSADIDDVSELVTDPTQVFVPNTSPPVIHDGARTCPPE